MRQAKNLEGGGNTPCSCMNISSSLACHRTGSLSACTLVLVVQAYFMSFLSGWHYSTWIINSLRKAKESLLESSIYHTIILMTLSLSIIKDLRRSFLIFTPKNSQFLKPQNLLQLLLILICFSSEIKATM